MIASIFMTFDFLCSRFEKLFSSLLTTSSSHVDKNSSLELYIQKTVLRNMKALNYRYARGQDAKQKITIESGIGAYVVK